MWSKRARHDLATEQNNKKPQPAPGLLSPSPMILKRTLHPAWAPSVMMCLNATNWELSSLVTSIPQSQAGHVSEWVPALHVEVPFEHLFNTSILTHLLFAPLFPCEPRKVSFDCFLNSLAIYLYWVFRFARNRDLVAPSVFLDSDPLPHLTSVFHVGPKYFLGFSGSSAYIIEEWEKHTHSNVNLSGECSLYSCVMLPMDTWRNWGPVRVSTYTPVSHFRLLLSSTKTFLFRRRTFHFAFLPLTLDFALTSTIYQIILIIVWHSQNIVSSFVSMSPYMPLCGSIKISYSLIQGSPTSGI